MKSTARRSVPSLRRLIAVAISTLLVGPAVLLTTTSAPANATILGKPTKVSLTFDDGSATQANAGAILTKRGLKGTFFVNSGFVNGDGFMTDAELKTLAANGHEIGGHTVNHQDLTALPPEEQKRQICNDRSALLAKGFAVRSFAYPFATSNASAEAAVQACGYNSGRGLGDLRTPDDTECSDCPAAATLPPANPYYTEAPGQVENSWSLSDLKSVVTRAERTGGWVQITFHNVCKATAKCDLNVTPTVLDSFALWLKLRALIYKTSVQTVGDVIGGPVAPAVSGPVPTPVEPGVNGVSNPGMETLGADGNPSCWMKGGYGANTPTLSVTTPGLTGQYAGQVNMANYVDGDAKWLPTMDLGGCAPTVQGGHTYSLRQVYTASSVTQFAVYVRNQAGAWRYWTSSPWFAATSTPTRADWTTPELPADVTGLSFGLTVFNNGTLVTDDAELYDTVGAPPLVAAQSARMRTFSPAPAARGTAPMPVKTGLPLAAFGVVTP